MSDSAANLHRGHWIPSLRKSRLAGGLLAAIVLCLFALANLPFRYVETEVEWIGYLEVAEGASYRMHQDMPVMAGWPLRYLIRYTDDGVLQHRLWLPMRLVMNLGLGALIALSVYLFVQIRHRKLIEFPDSHFLRRFFDCSVALAVLAVPGIIFGWQYRTTLQHREIANRLSYVGSTSLACWVPKVLDKHVPAGLMRRFVRIRQIHVFGADQSTADQIASLSTLAAFHSYAGKFDSRPLERFIYNPHFCALQLSGRELNDADLSVIPQLPWLTQLRLSRTNLRTDQLRWFDQSRLALLDLSRTNISLEGLGTPGWSTTIEELSLARPGDGMAASLNIHGWPRLRELKIKRPSSSLNDDVLSISLANLPRLEKLAIDRVQKHDLTLKNLPRLQSVDEQVAELRFLIGSDTWFPGLTWVRSLEIDGADSLTEFSCFARDLERFSIRNTPNLRSFAIGSYLTTLLGTISLQPVDLVLCQSWIEQLGTMKGPSLLNLEYLPLAGVELRPLASNQRVRHLQLQGTHASFAQVQQLEGMTRIENLNIRSTPLKQQELAWLLDRFPNMKKLVADARSLESFDLRGRTRLREMTITPMQELEEIRIVDLPQLTTSIRLTRTPKMLQIQNAPSLKGLGVECPWPENATFQGVRDLEWFTGGGNGITDQVVSEVLQCDSISRLTLAYPSVSADLLREIGELKELTFLALPGAAVTDDVVRNWSKIESLWEINLDDTSVSVETIAWLTRMESLRRVSLNRVPLNEEAIDALTELRQVSELYLAGVALPSNKLSLLLQNGSLETLDLSGSQLDEHLINTLCDYGVGLKHLILHETDISQAAFQRLMDAVPTLYVDLGKVPDFAKGECLVEIHRRADVLRQEMDTGWRLMLRPTDDVFQSILAHTATARLDSEIPGQGVPKLPPTTMSHLNRKLFTSSPSSN